MKTYTMTLSCTEVSTISKALEQGLWCAEQHQKKGMIGADRYVALIRNAIEVLNRPYEGGPESAEESNAAYMASAAAECAKYGCD